MNFSSDYRNLNEIIFENRHNLSWCWYINLEKEKSQEIFDLLTVCFLDLLKKVWYVVYCQN